MSTPDNNLPVLGDAPAGDQSAVNAAHTPGPWVIPNGAGNEHVICEGDDPTKPGRILFILENPRGTSRVLDYAELAACTAFIVRAVNCHDEMLAALRDVESKIVDFEAGRINWRPKDFLMRVRTAAAKAEGRTP